MRRCVPFFFAIESRSLFLPSHHHIKRRPNIIYSWVSFDVIEVACPVANEFTVLELL